MEVRELITKLGFNFDGKNANVYENKISSIKKAGLSLGTTLKAAFAGVTVAAIGAMVKSTLNFGDELLVASQITGIAVENLTNLRIAAKLANVEQGELTASLTIFSTKLANAKSGNESAVKSFSDLGINLAGIKTTDQGFKAASDALTKMKDGFEKTAAARELFGRGGGKLVALFQKDSGELKKFISVLDAYGGPPSKKFAEQSDAINDKLEIMGMILPRLRNTIVQGLYPAIEKLVDRFMDWSVANKEVISQRIETTIKAVEIVAKLAANSMKYLWNVSTFLWKKLKEYPFVLYAIGAAFAFIATKAFPLTASIAAISLLLEDFEAYSNGKDSLLGPFYDRVLDITDALEKMWTTFKNRFDDIRNYLKTNFPSFYKFITPDAGMPENIRKRIDSLNNPSGEKRDEKGRLIKSPNLQSLSDNLNSASPNLQSFVPSVTQILQTAGKTGNNQTIKNSTSVTVNVNASKAVDGNAVAEEIKKVTEKVLVEHYRNAFINGQGIEGR